MKTYNNLFPSLTTFTNLYWAYRSARRGKRSRAAVASFEIDLEPNLLALQRELIQQTYTPGGYHNFYIFEPKRRLVSAAPFRDRVVHHALMNIIEPLFERQFIHDSPCSVKTGGWYSLHTSAYCPAHPTSSLFAAPGRELIPGGLAVQHKPQMHTDKHRYA